MKWSSQSRVWWTDLAAVTLALLLTGSSGCSATDLGVTCNKGLALCGGACSDLARNHDNCGACGVACAGGQVCWAGSCTADCGGGTTKCGDACYDTAVDSSNCGGCGVACGAGSVCVAGTCQSTCTSPQTLCALPNAQPYCASLQTDNANCGACGNACDAALECRAGACAPPCSASQTACFPPNATPYCADTSSDPANCGQCGVSCGGGGGVCHSGVCACVGTKTFCGACTDTQTDNANCGACGATCKGTCSRGRCILTISSSFFPDGPLAADDQAVYAFAAGVGLVAVPNGGGSMTNLTAGYIFSGSLTALALDTSNVYFVDGGWPANARICRVAKSGGPVAMLANIADYVGSIVADANNLYARGGNYIYATPTGGGGITVVAPSDGSSFYGSAITTDGTTLWWATTKGGGGIESMPLGGGSVSTLYSGTASRLFADGGYVYFEGQFLERTQPSWNGASQALFLGTGPLALSMEIYLISVPTLWSIDRLTLVPTPLVDDSFAVGNYGQLAAGFLYIFWVDSSGQLKQTSLL